MKTTILNIMFLSGLSTMTGLSSCVSDEVKSLPMKHHNSKTRAISYPLMENMELKPRLEHVHTGKKTDRKPRFSTGILPMTK